MNSFHLTAIGRLAHDPEPGRNGEVRFALIGEDYAGKGREPVTTSADSTACRAIIPRQAGPPFHGKPGRLGRGRTT